MPGQTSHSHSLPTRFDYGCSRAHGRPSILQRLANAISDFAERSFPARLATRRHAIQHPEEAQLLAYIDGELSKTARQQVAHHLQSCWACRGQFRELCARVESYLVNRELQLPDSSDESGQRIDELRQRLAQIQQGLPLR